MLTGTLPLSLKCKQHVLPHHRCEMKSTIAVITEVVLVFMEKAKNIGEHDRIRWSETELGQWLWFTDAIHSVVSAVAGLHLL